MTRLKEKSHSQQFVLFHLFFMLLGFFQYVFRVKCFNFTKSLLLFIFSFSFLCAEQKVEAHLSKNVVVLSAGTVYEGDYFAIGDSIEISGTVNGDVYLFGEQVIVDGTVNGSVLACGVSIDISGNVSNNCRLLAGQVLIGGNVGNNVTVVAGNIQLLPSATIGLGLVSVAGNADLGAAIGANATIIASNLRISSHIKKNLQANAGYIRLTSRTDIGGNFDYRSPDQAWIESGAVIQGTRTHHPSFVHNLVKGTWIQGFLVGSKVIGTLMNFLYTLVIGILLVKVFPKNLEAALEVLETHPFKAIAYGLTLLILLPLVSLILLMTILGAPFAVTLIALNIIGFYTAKIYSIIWGANFLFRKVKLKKKTYLTLVSGLIIYFLLVSIPVFGTILSIIAMLFGVGAGVLSQQKRSIFNVKQNQ